MGNFYHADFKVGDGMPTIEDDRIYYINYCSICDASSSSGDNPFLLALGELQRRKKVALVLGSCVTCKGVMWHIKFVLE